MCVGRERERERREGSIPIKCIKTLLSKIFLVCHTVREIVIELTLNWSITSKVDEMLCTSVLVYLYLSLPPTGSDSACVISYLRSGDSDVFEWRFWSVPSSQRRINLSFICAGVHEV